MLYEEFSCPSLRTASNVNVLRNCLDKIPFRESSRSDTIKQFENLLDLHPFTDLFEDEEETLYLQEELNQLKTTNFTSDFQFHMALQKFALKIPDSNVYYILPTFYSSIQKLLPYTFKPKGSSKNIVIQNYNFLYFNENNLTCPESVEGKEVVSINGVPTEEYLLKNSFSKQRDSSVKFNFNYHSQRPTMSFYLSSDLFAENETFLFSDGTSETLPTSFILLDNPSKKDSPSVVKPIQPNNTRKDFDEIILSPILSLFESEDGVTRGYVLRQSDNKKIPFLRIYQFPSDSISTFQKVVINFLVDCRQRNSDVAIIDMTDSLDQNLSLLSWTVNAISNTIPRFYDRTTIDSPFHYLLRDKRITSYNSKFVSHLLLKSNASLIIDPTSGEPFKNLKDFYRNPIQLERSITKEQFTPLFFEANVHDEININIGHKTKFSIITNGICSGACAHLISALRSRNVAKVFGVGGITGKKMESSFEFGTDSLRWNNFVDSVLRDATKDNFKSLPFYRYERESRGDFNFALNEFYDVSSPTENTGRKPRKNQKPLGKNKQQQQQHQGSQQDEYDDEFVKYSQSYNPKKADFYLNPKHFSREYVDEIIGWDQFVLGISYENIDLLYQLVSEKKWTSLPPRSYQKFCTFGESYSNNNFKCKSN